MIDDLPPSRTERLFLRMTILQTVMTAAAVIISMAALYAAFVQAESARRQTEAAVWPYVDIGNTVINDDGERRGVIFMENTGIGPARIRAVRVKVDGEAQANWAEVFAAADIDAGYRYITMTNQVMSSEQALHVITLHSSEDAFIIRNQWSRIEIDYCYCSVFDQCWVQSQAGLESPEQVDQCPDWGADRFEN